MAFDPSVISEIQTGYNPVGAQKDALTLKDMLSTSQIRSAQAAEATSDQQDMQRIKGLQSKYDLSKPDQFEQYAAEATRINPKMGMGLIKERQAIERGSAELTMDQLGVFEKKRDIIDTALQPLFDKVTQFQTISSQLKEKVGSMPPQQQQQVATQLSQARQQLNAELAPQVMETVKALREQMLPNGKPLLNDDDLKQINGMISGGDYVGALASLKEKSKTNKAALQARMATLKEQTSVRNMESEIKSREEQRAETHRHNVETEKLRAGAGGGPEDSHVDAVYAAMADKGLSFPSGMRSVKAQRATVEGLIKAHPNDTPEQIADRLRSGALGLSGAKTELGVVARREGASAAAINALNREGGLYDQLLETGKKIDFGSAKFKNAFELWKQGAAIADPDISEYVNTLADTRAEFASVLARGGQVTDSVRIASEHAFPDKMSYGELQRNVERSKKVAKEIQAGNTAVADAIINGTPLEGALKAKPSSTPSAPGASAAPPPAAPGAGGAGPKKWKIVGGKLVPDDGKP